MANHINNSSYGTIPNSHLLDMVNAIANHWRKHAFEFKRGKLEIMENQKIQFIRKTRIDWGRIKTIISNQLSLTNEELRSDKAVKEKTEHICVILHSVQRALKNSDATHRDAKTALEEKLSINMIHIDDFMKNKLAELILIGKKRKHNLLEQKKVIDTEPIDKSKLKQLIENEDQLFHDILDMEILITSYMGMEQQRAESASESNILNLLFQKGTKEKRRKTAINVVIIGIVILLIININWGNVVDKMVDTEAIAQKVMNPSDPEQKRRVEELKRIMMPESEKTDEEINSMIREIDSSSYDLQRKYDRLSLAQIEERKAELKKMMENLKQTAKNKDYDLDEDEIYIRTKNRYSEYFD